MAKKKDSMPVWVYIVVGAFVLLGIVGGNPAKSIISGAIGLFVASACFNLSGKIKGANRTVALWIGILFGLFGWIGYWIFFKIKTRKKK